MCIRDRLRPGALARSDALAAHCAANLARYKVPARVAIVDALPKTSANKTDKNAIRRSLEETTE